MADDIADGVVHVAGDDLRSALLATDLVAAWNALTPLGCNEFLCWIEDAKQSATRARRIARTCDDLREGKKRPCCWAGCIHRTNKAPGRWQQVVLIDGKRS